MSYLIFFDNVIVKDKDRAIQKNRLELLYMLRKTFDNYLNFSNIEKFLVVKLIFKF